MSAPIFISHATADKAFVTELREALSARNLSAWVDTRELLPGNKLAPAIEAAITEARHFIVVISPRTVNSSWVRWEIKKALAVQAERGADAYNIIPLLLPGIEPTALGLWFDEEPLGVKVEIGPGGVAEALPAILAALGERLPEDPQPMGESAPQPVAELILKLEAPESRTEDGKTRAGARARLVYEPAATGERAVESRPFYFTSPLEPVGAKDLKWYLEEFWRWPTAPFRPRANAVENNLRVWGEELYKAALSSTAAQETLTAWRNAAAETERRFSIEVESALPEGSPAEAQQAASIAGSVLLSLPWELLRDDRSFLFHGKRPVRVRRRLPNYRPMEAVKRGLPIRVLLVSPRPEGPQGEMYIDHRISALPLVEAIESLGDLVNLTILTPPTLPTLEKALQDAADAGQPFDVIHFDGHGDFDHDKDLGALVFETPRDLRKLEKRDLELVHADKLAEIVRDYRIPLVFLEACRTAQTGNNAIASVAAKLLEEGAASVVAMTHIVLVETTRRFVSEFYGKLADGARIGAAMVAGQRALHNDSYRFDVMGAGALHLQDWFVPVLYQEKEDLNLFPQLLSKRAQQVTAEGRRLRLGALPPPPHHLFHGRSRELLALERLLTQEKYAVVRGIGGEGKTTIACELARWLVRTERFRRAAFVSLEEYTEVRGVLMKLGQQLLPEGKEWYIAPDADLKRAMQPVARALRDHPTIIVCDNLETILPVSTATPEEKANCREILTLLHDLLQEDDATRIVFTSRERLPKPFDNRRCDRPLGALAQDDAARLVLEVMRANGLEPPTNDAAFTPTEITELVEAVRCHARALVLLAQEIAVRGVRATTETIRDIMADLDARHPGDRENSLYASVELSLRRLPPIIRSEVNLLAVFHGGGRIENLAYVMEVEPEVAGFTGSGLIEVGLGEDLGDGDLRFDPALPLYLRGALDAEQFAAAQNRWATALQDLTRFLYNQRAQDVALASRLTRRELPNLLALLAWAGDNAPPETVVDLAGSMERLLADLGLPHALRQATQTRERAAQGLGAWGHARFQVEDAAIDRLLESGDLPAAYEKARQLLAQCQAAGETAYNGAAFDFAMAHFSLGRVLQLRTADSEALPLLSGAERRFQALADADSASAARMAAVAIAERGNCLMFLGRLAEAAAAYQEAIALDEKRGDQRNVAVGKFQLGTVYLMQQKYADALASYDEARDIFSRLGEPLSVAAAWHQSGIVHRKAENWTEAERAYREALAIKVREKHPAGQADSLLELGNLYDAMGRLEDAVTCFRQAADIHVRLKDLAREGAARNNLADTLIKLARYDEARAELLRAIECKEPYGHTAQPWKAWNILRDLEQAVGNPDAAREARARAVAAYRANRDDGGENIEAVPQLYALVEDAVQRGDTAEAEQLLTQLEQREDWHDGLPLLAKLRAILQGARDASLADDEALDYDDAVEIALLLERLATGK